MAKRSGRPRGSRTVSSYLYLAIHLAVDRIVVLASCSLSRAFEILADRGYSRLYVGDNSSSDFVNEISNRPFHAPIGPGPDALIGQIQTYRSKKTIAHYYYEAGKMIVDYDRPNLTAEDFCRDLIPAATYARMLNDSLGRPHEPAGWAIGWRPRLKVA